MAYLTAVLTDLLHTQRDPLALCLLLQAYDKLEPPVPSCGHQLARFHGYYSRWIPEPAREALVSCGLAAPTEARPWPGKPRCHPWATLAVPLPDGCPAARFPGRSLLTFCSPCTREGAQGTTAAQRLGGWMATHIPMGASGMRGLSFPRAAWLPCHCASLGQEGGCLFPYQLIWYAWVLACLGGP